MNDNQLLRYSRHILLPQIDIVGQEKLLKAHVLIVGVGGLGSPIALYLASSGVGTLTLCDGDAVALTNLQRQIVHSTHSLGSNKAHSAQRTLAGINPECRVVAISQRAAEEELALLVGQSDLVLDASDNFATRHAINRACVQFKKPLVSGAAARFDGQISVFDLSKPDSPCYHCLFPEATGQEDERCAALGVFAPLVGIIGSMQAAEALKLILGIGQTLQGRLLLLDSLAMEWRSIRLKKDPGCLACSGLRQ